MRGPGVHRPLLSLTHPIYLAGRGYTWETWSNTSSLDFDAAHEFHIERPSKCSNCIGNDIEQHSASLSLRCDERFKNCIKKNFNIKENNCEKNLIFNIKNFVVLRLKAEI